MGCSEQSEQPFLSRPPKTVGVLLHKRKELVARKVSFN